jgi:uncharacterized protein
MFKRQQYSILLKRLTEPRRFLQIIAGPRQVGKTTMVSQVLDSFSKPSHYVSFDRPALHAVSAVEQQWETARMKARSGETILVLDEIQKIPKWSDMVKALWDEDTHNQVNLRVVLLGSSPLLLQKGLSESLAGRFEVIRMPHWSIYEMGEAFGFDLDRYVFYGGYPGAASLCSDQARWANYIDESIVEPTIAKDVLLMTRIDKPSLLRQVFMLGCDYSGQILSFQKMLGQLQDAGNTTTVSHYLHLLNNAGMLACIPKFSGKKVRQRASSPKLNVLNMALMTAIGNLSFEDAHAKSDLWGRLLESTVGAHLLNSAVGTSVEVSYWREGDQEVDFVLRLGEDLVAIEVKSGRKKTALPGMDSLAYSYRLKRRLLVGSGGIPFEDFLKIQVVDWFKK